MGGLSRRRNLDHPAGPHRIRRGDDEYVRTRDMPLNEDGWFGRVARDGGDPTVSQRRDQLAVLLTRCQRRPRSRTR